MVFPVSFIPQISPTRFLIKKPPVLKPEACLVVVIIKTLPALLS